MVTIEISAVESVGIITSTDYIFLSLQSTAPAAPLSTALLSNFDHSMPIILVGLHPPPLINAPMVLRIKVIRIVHG